MNLKLFIVIKVLIWIQKGAHMKLRKTKIINHLTKWTSTVLRILDSPKICMKYLINMLLKGNPLSFDLIILYNDFVLLASVVLFMFMLLNYLIVWFENVFVLRLLTYQECLVSSDWWTVYWYCSKVENALYLLTFEPDMTCERNKCEVARRTTDYY